MECKVNLRVLEPVTSIAIDVQPLARFVQKRRGGSWDQKEISFLDASKLRDVRVQFADLVENCLDLLRAQEQERAHVCMREEREGERGQANARCWL